MKYKFASALAIEAFFPLLPSLCGLFAFSLFAVPVSLENVLATSVLLFVGYFVMVAGMYWIFALRSRGERPPTWENLSDRERSKIVISKAFGFD